MVATCLKALVEVATDGGVEPLLVRWSDAAVPLDVGRTNVDIDASVIALAVGWSLFDKHNETHGVHNALLPFSRLPSERAPHGIADDNAFRILQGRRQQCSVPEAQTQSVRRNFRPRNKMRP